MTIIFYNLLSKMRVKPINALPQKVFLFFKCDNHYALQGITFYSTNAWLFQQSIKASIQFDLYQTGSLAVFPLGSTELNS